MAAVLFREEHVCGVEPPVDTDLRVVPGDRPFALRRVRRIALVLEKRAGAQYGEAVREAADRLYEELKAQGVDVILDDRDMRPGVMFADWELIGVPHRVVIGDRGLKNGEVEYANRRNLAEKVMVKTEEAVEFVTKQIKR